MNNKHTYSDDEMLNLMSDIRNQQPVFEQEEETLQNIIQHLPEKRISNVQIITFSVMKYVASIASIFLLGLFVYQQINDNQEMNNLASNNIEEYQTQTTSSACNFTSTYAKEHPKEVLMCYLKENKRKNSVYKQIKNNLNQ